MPHRHAAFLFVAVGIQQWGTYDRDRDTLQVLQEAQAMDEDLVNLSPMLTISNGGTVYAVESTEVPGPDAGGGLQLA
jgi:hypothetical protein